METSAKEAKNIMEVFKLSANKILDNILKNEEKIIGNNNSNIKIKQNEQMQKNMNNKKNKKGCC